MIGRMRRTTCSTCRREVPAGRWCNWCGATLGAPPAPRSRARIDPRVAGGVAAAAVIVVAVVGALGPDGQDGPREREPSAVVLAEEAPLPPRPASPPSPPPEPPGERVDVICSDLRVRSVPVDDVATDVPGELVELANGTCVVMGPEGAVAP